MVNIYKCSVGVLATSSFAMLMATSAMAQTACINAGNPNACTVAEGQTLTTVTTTGVGSVLTNNGTITNGAATVNDNSNLVNAGTIGAVTRTFGNNSLITNSGTINALTTTFGNNSSITNSGTINGLVRTGGTGSSVTNTGVLTNGTLTTGNNSSITNSGSVTGLVRTDGNDSSVTNSGAINGGITITGNNPTLNLLSGSSVIGAIDLSGGGTSTINIPSGINVNYTITSGQPNVVNTNGAPFIQSGNQIIVFETTGFAAPSIFAGDLTSSVFNIIDNNQAQTVLDFNSNEAQVTKSGHNTTPYNSSHAWISSFGGFNDINGNQSLRNTYAGLLVGYETDIDTYNTIGAFGGASKSEIEIQTNTQTTDVDSFFGGAYWKRNVGKHRLHLAFVAGSADHSYIRSISNNTVAGGTEIARSDYDGWFVSPSATFLTPINFAGAQSTASLRVNYTGLFLDGSTETGTTTALAFADRDIHLLGARAQFTIPYHSTGDNGSENRLEWRTGLEGQFNLNSDDVRSTIAGTSVNFAADTEDQLSGFAGVSFTRTSADGLRSIGADVELQTGFLQNSVKVTGQVYASMKF